MTTNSAKGRSNRCRISASVRRGLRNVHSFCEVNQFENSELTPTGEKKLARDTAAALDWIDALLSVEGAIK